MAAEKDGIREVVPNMENSFFWSKTLDHPEWGPKAARYAGMYHGDSGGFSFSNRDFSYGWHDKVRCVGR
jgi:hypothetical protein